MYSSVILALYQSLKTHYTALKSLQREHKKHLERENALGEILDQLRTGYNPNYQDMAVKAAVKGYEELYASAPAVTASEPDADSSADFAEGVEPIERDQDKRQQEEKPQRVGDWELDQAERKDLEGLLLQDMQDSAADSDEGLCESFT